jgi:hypothetical protein
MVDEPDGEVCIPSLDGNDQESLGSMESLRPRLRSLLVVLPSTSDSILHRDFLLDELPLRSCLLSSRLCRPPLTCLRSLRRSRSFLLLSSVDIDILLLLDRFPLRPLPPLDPPPVPGAGARLTFSLSSTLSSAVDPAFRDGVLPFPPPFDLGAGASSVFSSLSSPSTTVTKISTSLATTLSSHTPFLTSCDLPARADAKTADRRIWTWASRSATRAAEASRSFSNFFFLSSFFFSLRKMASFESITVT